ncbi:hypothetical protein WJU23_14470 [Prosthecobacter sp. SYSU 5D2]|uniref:hypothetical protein n=1 Tax=Prosthecobacter sp. SYSU 5D2 TaxID=3134134 RepID=UPI0031FEDD87
MANIPLFHPGSRLVDSGQRTARVAQLTADTSGAAWGQVAAQAGRMVTDHAMERRREKDAVVMIGLEGKMQEMALQQRQFQQQEPDPDQWETHWQKLKTDFESQALGQADLSRAASRAMAHTLARYSQGHALRIREAAGHQSRQRLAAAVTARIQAARTPEEVAQVRPLAHLGGMADEDFDALAIPAQKEKGLQQVRAGSLALVRKNGMAGLAQAQSLVDGSPYLSPGEKEAMNNEIGHEARKSDILATVRENPHAALQQAKALGGAAEKEIQNLAAGRIQELRAETLGRYKESIYQGGLPDRKELESDPNLTPYDRAVIMDFASSGPANDPVGYASLYAEAAGFQGSEGSPGYAVLDQRIHMALDGEPKTMLQTRLRESVNGKKHPAMKNSRREIYAMMKADMKAGRFGTWERPLLQARGLSQTMRSKVDAMKATLEKEKGALWWTEKKDPDELEREARSAVYQQEVAGRPGPPPVETFMVIDEDLKSQALHRYQDLVMAMEQWEADHPKAMPQDLRAAYGRLTVRYRSFAPLAPPETPPLPHLSASGAIPANDLKQAYKALNYAPPGN